MFAPRFPPASPPAGHPVHAAHGRHISEGQQQLTQSIAEAQLARERLGATATIAPTKSEAASDTTTTTTSRSRRGGTDEDEDEDEDDPNTDLQAGGNIYNYSEIHARVTQAAGHGSQISNGNTVMAPGRGGVGGSLTLVLGVVVGALACSLWHSRKI